MRSNIWIHLCAIASVDFNHSYPHLMAGLRRYSTSDLMSRWRGVSNQLDLAASSKRLSVENQKWKWLRIIYIIFKYYYYYYYHHHHHRHCFYHFHFYSNYNHQYLHHHYHINHHAGYLQDGQTEFNDYRFSGLTQSTFVSVGEMSCDHRHHILTATLASLKLYF